MVPPPWNFTKILSPLSIVETWVPRPLYLGPIMSSKLTLVPSLVFRPEISMGVDQVQVDLPTPIMCPGASPASIGFGASVACVHWRAPEVFVCAPAVTARARLARIARDVWNRIFLLLCWAWEKIYHSENPSGGARAAVDFGVGVDESEAAVRAPAVGEAAHPLLGDAGAVAEELHRDVLDHAEVSTGEDVGAAETAQQRDLGGPAADALDGSEPRDRFLVGKRRDLVLGHDRGGECLRGAQDRPGLGSREPESPESLLTLSRDAGWRRKVEPGFPVEARAPAVGDRELAPHAVGEGQVDLLGEHRRDDRLPQGRRPGDPQAARVPQRVG